MIKIGLHKEISKINQVPKEVYRVINDILKALDKHYGSNREIDKDMGGYILIITKEEELDELTATNININQSYPEYVDRIVVQGDNEEMGDWTNSLILSNNDFGISLIMPVAITPKNFINEMV